MQSLVKEWLLRLGSLMTAPRFVLRFMLGSGALLVLGWIVVLAVGRREFT